MADNWRRKPGNKFVRPRRIRPFRLRKVLGIPGLFSIGYGDVGSAIYFALGVIAFVALGATPIALGIAGLLYIFNALTYAEGSAVVPGGGGSAAYARSAFNDLAGFASAWVVLFSYVVIVAIAAYTIPPYLSHFWPVLSNPVPGTIVAIVIVLFLMLMNIIGIGEWSGFNIFFVTFDIVVQIILIMLGVILLFVPAPLQLFRHMFGAGNWPTVGNFIFGIAVAALCFTGVESVAQHTEETQRPEKKMLQTYIPMVLTVLILFAGVSLVALTAMAPQQLGDPINGWARNPVAGIATAVSSAIMPDQIVGGIQSEPARNIIRQILIYARDWLPGLVSILACTILLMATNTGILGITRLTYNLSKQRQLPATLSRIHHRFRTPYLSIIVFGIVSVMMLLPGFVAWDLFINLAALYVFGSLLAFAIAHASILRLRITRPEAVRPFKLHGNINVWGYKLPITAILGLFGTVVIWLTVMLVQPQSWWIGIVWLILGFLIYYIYRRSQNMPLLRTPDENIDEGRENHE